MNWDSFQASLDTVINAGLERGNQAGLLTPARAAFFELTGQPFAEETGADLREQAFYEFFVFDFPQPDQSLAQQFTIPAEANDAVAEAAIRLQQNDFVVGSIAGSKDGAIQVKSWLDKKKFHLQVPSTAGFSKDDAVLARYFLIDGELFASPACEIISEDLADELKRQLKWLATTDTTQRDMWAGALRFHLVARRYSAAKPKEIVDRWISLEKQRGSQ